MMTLSSASGGSSSVGASGNGNTAQGNLPAVANGYEVVATGVHDFFDDFTKIPEPSPGEPFYGQDADYPGIEFSYEDNGDGTMTDLNTGLMWEQIPNLGDKMSWDESIDYCDEAATGGYEDWRVPSVKELVSITDFTGNINTATPYLDT